MSTRSNIVADTIRQKAEKRKKPKTPKEHPLAPLAGKYEGEEWEALLEAVRRNREELTAQELAAEEMQPSANEPGYLLDTDIVSNYSASARTIAALQRAHYRTVMSW